MLPSPWNVSVTVRFKEKETALYSKSPLLTPRLQHRVARTFLSPYLLFNSHDRSEASTFYTIQVGGAYSMAAMQHTSNTRGNRCTECYSLHLPRSLDDLVSFSWLDQETIG